MYLLIQVQVFVRSTRSYTLHLKSPKSTSTCTFVLALVYGHCIILIATRWAQNSTDGYRKQYALMCTVVYVYASCVILWLQLRTYSACFYYGTSSRGAMMRGQLASCLKRDYGSSPLLDDEAWLSWLLSITLVVCLFQF